MLFRLRLRALCAALVAIASFAAAAPASASVRASGSPRCTSNGDWPVASNGPIQTSISVEPGNTLRRIVTIDFDRDGDLDVLASTDRGLRVWLNDGRGNLVSQPAQAASPITNFTGVGPQAGIGQDSTESIQNDLPSYSVPRSRSHAAPAAGAGFAHARPFATLRAGSRSSLAPRAPPLPLLS